MRMGTTMKECVVVDNRHVVDFVVGCEKFEARKPLLSMMIMRRNDDGHRDICHYVVDMISAI
jgi:hypothetical protein